MTDSDVEEFLSHHGVLGMHWGKHLPGRDEPSHNGKATSKTGKKLKPKFGPGTHPEHRQTHTLVKKPINQLSTKDLKSVNNRLKAEKEFKQLTDKPTVIKKGHNYVKEALAIGGTAVAAGLFIYKGVKFVNNTGPGGATEMINNFKGFPAGAAKLRNVVKAKSFINFATESGAAKVIGTDIVRYVAPVI